MTVRTIRRVENRRLVYYRSKADATYWDAYWRDQFSLKKYQRAEQGNLGKFEDLFTRYLPRSGRILHAGCGLGAYVLALRARGYDVHGIEWGVETVQTVKNHYPRLPISVGDVTCLDVPDASYRGYLSLGVVEHRRDGPEPYLDEAHRVLSSGGVALISVPHFHALRRFKARLGLYHGEINDLQFFQYAFTETEFTELLRAAGFKVLERVPLGGHKGLADEIGLLEWTMRWRAARKQLRKAINSSLWAREKLSHTVMFVCEKP
jgi:SAM-dependent methyltransferase